MAERPERPDMPVRFRGADRHQLDALQERYQRVLGLRVSQAETLGLAVRLAMSASDEDLKRGEL